VTVGLRDLLGGSVRVPASTLERATTWINPPPLAGTSLRGHVVAYQFWTYTCINWLRTLPYVRAWAHRYSEHGLFVVGIHTPEFGFEAEESNVREAVAALQVDYPVVVDSDYAIWKAFTNHYWPALYIADANGVIRYQHFGEGAYDESERAIRDLLAQSGVRDLPHGLAKVHPAGLELSANWEFLGSPETYLGSDRGERYAGRHKDSSELVPGALALNHWTLAGDWQIRSDAAVLEAGAGAIAYRFRARDVNLVMASSKGAIPFQVRLDGRSPYHAHGADCNEQGNGVVSEARLYQLIRRPDPRDDQTIEIAFAAPGASAFAFTFG
jgi:thiol-disulfide isomerase/thioredoxin